MKQGYNDFDKRFICMQRFVMLFIGGVFVLIMCL